MNHPLLHIANVLYVISYSVRDILWLRLISVLAMVCLSICYLHSGLFWPLYWQAAFIAINAVQILLLLRERRPVDLTPAERKMYETALKTLSPQQVRRLMSKATYVEAKPGETIVPEGVQHDALMLITEGAARVTVAGEQVASILPGQFVGEMSFLTGNPTSACVTARGGVKYVAWSEDVVREASEKDGTLGEALQAALGADLVWKLLDQRSRQVHGTGLETIGTVTLPRTQPR